MTCEISRSRQVLNGIMQSKTKQSVASGAPLDLHFEERGRERTQYVLVYYNIPYVEHAQPLDGVNMVCASRMQLVQSTPINKDGVLPTDCFGKNK